MYSFLLKLILKKFNISIILEVKSDVLICVSVNPIMPLYYIVPYYIIYMFLKWSHIMNMNCTRKIALWKIAPPGRLPLALTLNKPLTLTQGETFEGGNFVGSSFPVTSCEIVFLFIVVNKSFCFRHSYSSSSSLFNLLLADFLSSPT